MNNACVSQCTFGSQRHGCRRWFSPLTMWGLGIKLRSSDLAVGLKLAYVAWEENHLELLISTSAGTTGKCYYAWFIQCQSWVPGDHTCQVSTLPTELYSSSRISYKQDFRPYHKFKLEHALAIFKLNVQFLKCVRNTFICKHKWHGHN